MKLRDLLKEYDDSYIVSKDVENTNCDWNKCRHTKFSDVTDTVASVEENCCCYMPVECGHSAFLWCCGTCCKCVENGYEKCTDWCCDCCECCYTCGGCCHE